MILSRKLSDALNEQINMEMWSSNLYLSMSVHFTQIGLDGFAHWTLKQSQEELEHAYKMIDYSIKRGGRYLRREFSYSKFQQTMVLPDNVEKDKIEAKVENGVLSISIPKRTEEEAKMAEKVIEIK